MHELTEEGAVLGPPRARDPEVPADTFQIVGRRAHRRHEKGGIAGNDTEDQEHEDAHPPQRQESQRDAAEQEPPRRHDGRRYAQDMSWGTSTPVGNGW